MPILFSERAPDELIGISAILVLMERLCQKGGIIAGKTPEEHKEVVYDLKKLYIWTCHRRRKVKEIKWEMILLTRRMRKM